MAHFILTMIDVTTLEVARLFMDNIYRLHGMPESIVSDRDICFMSKFWRTLFELLGMKLTFSTAFHPQTDGQTKCIN